MPWIVTNLWLIPAAPLAAALLGVTATLADELRALRALPGALERSEEWRSVYGDELGVVFARRSDPKPLMNANGH